MPSVVEKVRGFAAVAVVSALLCAIHERVAAAEPAGEPIGASLPRFLSPFDYYVRFDALSDLVERGISRAHHQPTGVGTAVVTLGNFYVTGSVYGLDNHPAGARLQAQGAVAAGYETRFGKLVLDASISQEVGPVNGVSSGSTEINAKARYALTNKVELTSFLWYSPYDDRHRVLSGGGGLRTKLTPDLTLFSQLGWARTFDIDFDKTTSNYMYWQSGLAYRVNNYVSTGLTYDDSALSKSRCAQIAESHSTHSCGASITGRLSLKLYREDFEGKTFGGSEPAPLAASSDPPPLDMLVKKLPKRRGDDDDLE